MSRDPTVENPISDNVSIQALILANHVEGSPNGLLYISGGGALTLNRLIVEGAGMPVSRLGVAVILAVPWTQTNRVLGVHVVVRDEDAVNKLMEAKVQVNVGRPPNLRPGAVQYPGLAIPLDVIFPKAGTYEVVAEIEGEPSESSSKWVFSVTDLKQGGIRIA